jgi:hypothetical protein
MSRSTGRKARFWLRARFYQAGLAREGLIEKGLSRQRAMKAPRLSDVGPRL